MKESSDVSTFTYVNPANEEAIAEVELADVDATDAAIAKAQTAFDEWRKVAPGDRAAPGLQSVVSRVAPRERLP